MLMCKTGDEVETNAKRLLHMQLFVRQNITALVKLIDKLLITSSL